MRIIDLLNRLINNEQMPKGIELICDNTKYMYEEETSDYIDEKGNYLFEEIENYMNTKTFLNEEIEILED